MNLAHKTAISRKKPSVPASFLSGEGLLVGRVLDFGCGQGMDANAYGLEKYDPYYAPEMPIGRFETVVCNYVLNVAVKEKEQAILEEIKDKLVVGGIAYITVRRDIVTEGKTKKGTFQRNVLLDLPKVKETSRFCIYKLVN